MVGHYLLTLTPEQEGRVLTQNMNPVLWALRWTSVAPPRCLIMVAENMASYKAFCPRHSWKHSNYLGQRYDDLCLRFGTGRVNAAIRNRVLSNIARRELAGVRATASV